MSSWHEPNLARVNHLRHVGFEPLDNDTRHQSVKGIAETYGTKLGDKIRVGYFWNKNQICDTLARRDHVLGEDILNDLNNDWAQTCPMRLEKERMISIRSRGLRRGEPPEGLENFFRRRGSS